MLSLYGEKKTNNEVRDYCSRYIQSVVNNTYDRYHSMLSLVPLGNSQKLALDYGCGWGHYTQALNKEKKFSCIGIDYSQNEIDICNLIHDSNEGVKYKNSKISDFPDNTFDIVFSNQVIEHVHNPGNYLSEINRTMINGGHLVIGLPNVMSITNFSSLFRFSIKNRLCKLSSMTLENYDKTHDHIQSWDPYHFVRLVSSLGFRLEEYIPMEGISIPFKYKPYINIMIPFFRHYSYTMGFRFKKIKYVSCDKDS